MFNAKLISFQSIEASKRLLFCVMKAVGGAALFLIQNGVYF
jgi:hypothetical protein